MRIHKYRAWDKVEKVMCGVSLINFEKGCLLAGNSLTEASIQGGFLVGVPPEDNHGHFVNFEDLELMEFTGLLDKNGLEIYESDIIQECKAGELIWENQAKIIRGPRGVVGWSRTGWELLNDINGEVELLEPMFNRCKGDHYILCASDYDGQYTWPEDIAVIGNIYEHPHLLKDGIYGAP